MLRTRNVRGSKAASAALLALRNDASTELRRVRGGLTAMAWSLTAKTPLEAGEKRAKDKETAEMMIGETEARKGVAGETMAAGMRAGGMTTGDTTAGGMTTHETMTREMIIGAEDHNHAPRLGGTGGVEVPRETIAIEIGIGTGTGDIGMTIARGGKSTRAYMS